MHINEESNTKNVITEDQYFPSPCKYNTEQEVVNNTEVLKITKRIYVNGKVCGQIMKSLVDTGADVTLILLNFLKNFPTCCLPNGKISHLKFMPLIEKK